METPKMRRQSVIDRRKRAALAASILINEIAEPAVVRELAIRYLTQEGIDAELKGIGVEFRMKQRIIGTRLWLKEQK